MDIKKLAKGMCAQKTVHLMLVLSFLTITKLTAQVDTPENMVFVKGGVFEMGDTFGTGDEDEYPIRTVKVDDFYMDEKEVTVAEYRAFVQETGRKMPPAPPWGWVDDHPMVMVSWEEAKAYAEWNGKRLPTEAEWEYAARSGGQKYKWSETNDSTNLEMFAHYGDKEVGALVHKKRKVGEGTTQTAGVTKPNSLGLYDMNGNVWEWTHDWYAKKYQTSDKMLINPKGPESGLAHVVRGGSWFGWAETCRNTNRWYFGHRYVREDDIGFRCVMEVK